MSFPRYPKYKESGVEWLGEVPEHWEIFPVKRFMRLVADPAPNDNDYELLSIYTEIGVRPRKELEAKGNKATTTDGYWKVQKGDLIVNKLLAWMGAIGISNYDGVTSPAYDILRQTRPLDPRFYDYLFRCGVCFTEFRRYSRGIMDMRLRLYFEDLGQLPMPFPSVAEQAAIAAFLDRETAKIDALVQEQERLIELLKEKRRAVISHAVTKGLNPNATMKDSGIEWLGQVPAHWEVMRLKFLCQIQTGDKDTENAVEDGKYPFFVRSQTVERIDSMAFDCEAVLTAGDGVGVGKVFHHYTGPFDFHQRVYMLNNFSGVSGRFVYHFLKENFYKVALEGGAKSTVDSLRRPVFTNFAVCVPPVKEQSQIVAMIEEQATKFDELTVEAQRAIDLLQERRTALISAAVTGKIDVRKVAAKMAQEVA